VYVVQSITIDESFPLALEDPPPPTTTAPKALLPVVSISKFLRPPAPPPPPEDPGLRLPTPPPPPPATIKVWTNLVPGCVVTALGVLDVLTVCVFLPRDVTFTGPIIPPFPCAII
jgi:hypothetical protein